MSKRKFTADPEAAQAERRDLVAKLESGFQRVQQSDSYRSYLKAVSKFHQYSASNVMLIWTQRPDATYVAGFHTWSSLGRHVRKGEKGIRILAPMSYKTTAHNDQTGEDEERIGVRGFRAVAVFDIAQTEGEELPEAPCNRLTGDDRGMIADLTVVAMAEGLTIDRTPARAGADTNGFYARAQHQIWVSPELEPAAEAKTLAHELAHHFAEHIDSREEHETIAESVAYIVLGHFGIDASDYSFGYLASWTDVPTFKAKLGDIQTIANEIIGRVEGSEVLAQAA